MKRVAPRVVAVFLLVSAIVFCLPHRASAQSGGWQVDIAPFYLWLATTSGNLGVNDQNIPVYLNFADALDKLAASFSIHGEARKGKWGLLADYYFVRLSTNVSYTTPVIPITVSGTITQGEHVFDAAATYWFRPDASIVGGVRVFTISPSLHYNLPIVGQNDFSTSKTAPAGFAGIIYRPRVATKVVLLTRADIGGGPVLTWSATGGVDFELTHLIGLVAAYHALGVRTGTVQTGGPIPTNLQLDMNQYGPEFAVNLHWGEK